MKISDKGIQLLTELEGLRLKAYKCSKGVWTIGLGNTFYENGKPVKQGDVITKERAIELFHGIAKGFEKAINESVKQPINQNQYDSLFCFAWNVGPRGFRTSQLLKQVNKNPNDKAAITQCFLNWKGKKNLLLTRRNKEIKNYFL
jgi:lysozyme